MITGQGGSGGPGDPGDPGGSGGPGDPGGPGGQCFALITYLVDIVCPHQRLRHSPRGRAQGCWGMCALEYFPLRFFVKDIFVTVM